MEGTGAACDGLHAERYGAVILAMKGKTLI
jgi:hypothetical protein